MLRAVFFESLKGSPAITRFSSTDIRNENPKFFGETYQKYYAGYKRLQAFADRIERPMNEICVNWLRQNDAVTAIIGGASSLKQLEANVRAMNWDLTGEQLAEISEIIEPFRYM